LAAVLVAVSLVSGLVAPGAQAITRAQAARVALRVLQPSLAGGPVVVFGLLRPLPKGSDVVEAGPGVFSRHHVTFKHRGFDTRMVLRLRAPRLRAAAWLFWEDLAPGAFFAHPSVLLLIDARSGRAVMRERLAWAPVVNGVRPVFLRSVAGYSGSRYRVFTSPAAVARRQRATSIVRRVFIRARVPKASAALASNFNLSGVCFIAAGGTDEALAKGDFKAISDMASTLHRPLAVAGTVTALQAAIDRSSVSCNHVVLFLIGHGGPPPLDVTADGGWGNLLPFVAKDVPCVTFKGPDNGHGQSGLNDFRDRLSRVFSLEVLCVDQLRGMLARHPKTKFDVQILSCFGGRLVPPLTDLQNVASVGSASGPKREAPGNYGRPSDFTQAVVDGVLSWANDPKAVSETGGDITGALEDGDRNYGAVHLDREPEVYDEVHGEILQYDQAHPQGQYVPSPGHGGVVPCTNGRNYNPAAKFGVYVTTSSGQGDGDVIVSPPGQTLKTQTGTSETFSFCFGGPVTVTLKEVASGSARPGGWTIQSSVFAGRSPDRCQETGSNISPDVATCTLVFTADDVAWARSHGYGFGAVDATPTFRYN
jgi:hypothetical protein